MKCPDPVAPANGGMSFSGNDVGDTATYTCDSGFELTGEATATCTEDAGGNSASFQPAPPTCQCMCAKLHLHIRYIIICTSTLNHTVRCIEVS